MIRLIAAALVAATLLAGGAGNASAATLKDVLTAVSSIKEITPDMMQTGKLGNGREGFLYKGVEDGLILSVAGSADDVDEVNALVSLGGARTKRVRNGIAVGLLVVMVTEDKTALDWTVSALTALGGGRKTAYPGWDVSLSPVPDTAVVHVVITRAEAASHEPEPDNPRGWHLEKGMTSAERAATLKVMAIMEKECPALKRIEWARIPWDEHEKSAQWRVNPVGPSYPDPEEVWGGPTIEGWRVEFFLMARDDWKGKPDTYLAVTAGGPEHAGLAVGHEGGYAGAAECNLTEDRPGGYKYRAVPELAPVLSTLTK